MSVNRYPLGSSRKAPIEVFLFTEDTRSPSPNSRVADDSLSGISAIYEDRWIVVLEKPSGLLAVPGRGDDKQDCLSARALAVWPTSLVVHRLDRDTSGLMLLALDPETQRHLSRQFHDRNVAKAYVAEVFGHLPAETGQIDLPLAKDFDHPPRHRVDTVHGRPSSTVWKVLARKADGCRLELRPITGRSHQLRVHLSHIGHPVLGDNLYAHEAARLASDRLMLHAESLSLRHPVSGLEMNWRSDPGW